MRSLGRFLTSYWLLCPLLTLLLLAGSLLDYPPLRRLELPFYDQLVALRSAPLNTQVVLLAIDQQSRASQGEKISSRASLVTILEKLRELGVTRIALLTPLSFPSTTEADQTLVRQLASTRPVLAVEPLRSATLTTAFPDRALLPLPAPLPSPQQLLLALHNPLAAYHCDRLHAQSFLPPAKIFQVLQLPLGQLEFERDPDGQIRSLPLLLLCQGQLLPALPLQLVLLARGEEPDRLQLPPPELSGILQVGQWHFPVAHDYRMLLNLSAQGRPYLQYPVNQLLTGELDKRKLAGKLVLIGPTESFGDRQPLADQGLVGNSELAALATATLLSANPLHRPSWGWLAESLVLLYFLILLLLLVPRLSARAGLLCLALFLGSWWLAAAISLIVFGLWLQVVPALLLCLPGYLLIRWHVSRHASFRSQLLSNRQLALSFQEQGLLEQALEKFLQFPVKDQASKEMLYNLGLDFERKRMPHKALTAYRHLQGSGRFRDVRERLKQLQTQEQALILPQGQEATLVLDRPGEKPTLGRYRIERILGQGAMGTVYQGIDPKINRQVAIKTLAYQQIAPEQLAAVKERFFREAEAAGRLNHPQIVTIYDVGEEKDLAYLAMELLDGRDLSDYCRADQLLPLPRVLQLLGQVAQALGYAHRQGVVHRDIKPANLIVLRNGQIKIVDFGVARVVSSSQTETGVILGTPSYMSPEQVTGKKVDGRSDLFSLGVVMYELLSGQKPFQGDSMAALMYNISNCHYRPLNELRPKLPNACQAILQRLLQKGVTRRFKSAALLAEELEALQRKLES